LASRPRAAAASAQVAPSNAFAASFGGGLDVKLFQRLSWRPSQVEYLLTRFPETTTNRQNAEQSPRLDRRRFPFSKFHVTDGLLGISGRKFQAAIQIDLPLRFIDGAPLG
jgi:hypothetical protein